MLVQISRREIYVAIAIHIIFTSLNYFFMSLSSTRNKILTLWYMSSFFPPVLERQPKIASYRLPTQRNRAHRTFLLSLLILNRNFDHTLTIVTDMQQKVN